ncbi:MAG: alpha/beta fold hydrolase [Salinisphaeraceae bacterium]
MSDSLRHIDVYGHRIAIASHNEEADGPPLVVIHGVSLSLNVWPHALHHTLRHRRWYAVGLPAHFPSQPPAGFNDQPMPPSLFGHGLLEAIRAVIGDEAFTVMGHSTGGYSALAIAAEAPDQVRAVCAISPVAQGRWRGIIGLLQFLAPNTGHRPRRLRRRSVAAGPARADRPGGHAVRHHPAAGLLGLATGRRHRAGNGRRSATGLGAGPGAFLR